MDSSVEQTMTIEDRLAEIQRSFQKLEDKLSGKWVKSKESCEYYCKSCSSGRYYRSKREDLRLCWQCFKNGAIMPPYSPVYTGKGDLSLRLTESFTNESVTLRLHSAITIAR
ncbi:hypothetical protein K7X08_016990 [Anisodus acutangulus]|uniref:Uncharacterized protein n=1 Tax=Anisodus acutangulus TaxID=402998 RepID=A0A9Q1LTP8_9SOLA|nr:hypothetical protein K7X08_016990 [Anisodus acutangulus]